MTWSINGTQHSAEFDVTDITADTIYDVFAKIGAEGSAIAAIDGTTGNQMEITAAGTGTSGQINGFTIEVKSVAGVRK